MRRPKHFTPPRFLNVDFNSATGLYDISVRNPLIKDKPVYSMPLEIIRVLSKYYHLKNCGSNIPSLERFYNDLSREDMAQVICSEPKVKPNDFFPDPKCDQHSKVSVESFTKSYYLNSMNIVKRKSLYIACFGCIVAIALLIVMEIRFYERETNLGKENSNWFLYQIGMNTLMIGSILFLFSIKSQACGFIFF